ncbi:MAG: MmcQ/YjbR family DNA-binding protein [Fimbriimonadales bacterium]
MDEMTAGFEPVLAVSREAAWPGVTEGLSYGTPALRVGSKFFLRLREPDVLVIRCDLDEKEFLMMAAPDIYFETDHYKGWPAVLIRLSKIDKDELRERLEKSWRMLATKKMIAEYDSGRSGH